MKGNKKGKGFLVGASACLGVALMPGPLLLIGGVCAAGYVIAQQNKKQQRRRSQQQLQQQRHHDDISPITEESYVHVGRWLEQVQQGQQHGGQVVIPAMTSADSAVAHADLPTAMPVPDLNGSFVSAWDWAVSPSERRDYGAAFKLFDERGTGYLSYAQARAVVQQTQQEESVASTSTSTSISPSSRAGDMTYPSATASGRGPFATASRRVTPANVLDKAMQLADVDADGKYDEDEFALLIHLVKVYCSGGGLPSSLTHDLIPPCKRLLAGSTSTTTTLPYAPAAASAVGSTVTSASARSRRRSSATSTSTVTTPGVVVAVPLPPSGSSRNTSATAAPTTVVTGAVIPPQQSSHALVWDATPLSASSTST